MIYQQNTTRQRQKVNDNERIVNKRTNLLYALLKLPVGKEEIAYTGLVDQQLIRLLWIS